MADSGAQLSAGTVISGSYEVLHQIGRGGMGEVWLAKHLRLPKQVAIKVLRTHGPPLSEDALARFRREAEIASRLGHPNIVEVHDFNTLPSGDPYLVLELLEGEPLSRKLRRGPLSLDEARSIVRQVGSALQAAHAMGVVHRDLKPDNIYLLPSPLGGLRVKVLDFGISKIQDSNTVQTQEAVLVGTPQYMSPEQATGSNKDVGPQADVFALGAITYEMLTGEAAFAGESVAQVVFKVAYEKHRPLAERLGPEVPATAVQAVEKALAKDRAQRTADIGAYVEEFTGVPITLSPHTPVPALPQLAVLATPSVEMSASLGVAETAHSTPRVGSSGRRPPPAAPASSATSSGRTTSQSGSTPVVVATSSTGGWGRYVQYASAAAALLVVLGVGLNVTRGLGSPDGLAGEVPAGDSVSSPAPAAVSSPPAPKPPATPELPAPRPPPSSTGVQGPPRPPPSERHLTPEEHARLDDLEKAARVRGRKPLDLEALQLRYNALSADVENPVALDRMRAVVALAACQAGDDTAYFAFRDRITTPRIKKNVVKNCEPQR